ncbi:MAG: NAD(P)-dependent oxidoreductase [Ramlibacter sp.]
MTRLVSIVGVGNMGGGMAANLLSQGWGVRVHDIDPAKVEALVAQGAVAAATPGECAAASALTIVCVVDAAQTQDVLFGAPGVAAAVPAGHTIMLCPTLSPQDVEGFSQRLAGMALHAIDAPMSGGPARARDGTMSLMVACADAVFRQHGTLINTLSSRVFRISQQPGDAARTKLVNNLLAGINLVGAAEVMALAARMGLDLERTLDVIEQSSGQSWIGSDRMRRAIAGDYAPRAHVTLLRKDTRLAMQAAQAVGFEGPLGAAARDTFERAAAAGLEGLDDAAIYQLLNR